MMSDAKKMTLRERIEAGQQRQAKRSALGENASAARDKLTTIAREHPLLLIGGGLAIGFALSTLIPKSPTRKLSKRSLSMLATVAQLGITYGGQAMNALSEAAGDAAEKAGDGAESGRAKLDELGDAIAKGATRVKDRVRASTGG